MNTWLAATEHVSALPRSIWLMLCVAIVLPSDISFAQEEHDELAKDAFQLAVAELKEFNQQHSRVFKDGSVPIHFLAWTDQGVPLILLHGTYSSAHDFARFGKRLTDAGYRPISVDWYGHGQTPIPEQPVSATDFAKDLALLLDSLNIEKAVVAGHSRGGMLASAFYSSFPNRVQGLVLMDGGSTCMADYFASLGEEKLRAWMETGFDSETGKPLAPSYASLEDLFIAAWLRFGQPNDPKEMFDILSQSGANDSGRWTQWRPELRRWLGQDNLENTFNGMFNPRQAPLFFSSTVVFNPVEAFESLDVPVLILDAAGNHEHYRDSTPTADNERLRSMHPELVQHKQLPTGHFVHREQPEKFVEFLIEFKERTE